MKKYQRNLLKDIIIGKSSVRKRHCIDVMMATGINNNQLEIMINDYPPRSLVIWGGDVLCVEDTVF